MARETSSLANVHSTWETTRWIWGSLLLATICHASSNTVSIFLPMANTVSSENMGSYVIWVLLEVVVAIAVTVIAGPARLSRTEPMQVQE